MEELSLPSGLTLLDLARQYPDSDVCKAIVEQGRREDELDELLLEDFMAKLRA